MIHGKSLRELGLLSLDKTQEDSIVYKYLTDIRVQKGWSQVFFNGAQ